MVYSLNSKKQSSKLKPLPMDRKANSLTPATDPSPLGKKNRRNTGDSFGTISESEVESLPNSLRSRDSFSSTKSGGSSSTKSSRQGICSLRNVSGDDVRQVLTRLGFKDRAQKGSHHNLVSPHTHRSVTVPDHGSRHPLAAGTLNSILNDVEDILEKEVAVLPESKSRLSLGKDDIRAWMSDPKGCRQEIKAFAEHLAKMAI